jgi:vacuolar-type H+-ATPase subunit D/Vma8
MAGETTIERDLEIAADAFNRLRKASAESNKELREVQNNLKLNPESSSLLADKQEILARQLQNAKERAEELKNQIELLNSEQAKDIYTTEQITNRNNQLERQLTSVTREIEGLKGATQSHVEVQEQATESTKSFSESMTEFQSNLRAMRQVMSGVHSTFLLFGGDDKSAMGQMIKQSQQVVSAMSGILSMGKLLTSANKTLALSTAAAFAGFYGATAILNQFDGAGKTIAQTIGTIVGVAGAAALAIMAMKGALNPFGVAASVAAIGVGIASIKSMLPTKETLDTNLSTSISNSSRTTTPSIPSSGTTGSTTSSISYISQGNLTKEQVRDAMREAIEDSGLGNLRVIERQAQNPEVFYELSFNDLLSVNRRRGTILITK